MTPSNSGDNTSANSKGMKEVAFMSAEFPDQQHHQRHRDVKDVKLDVAVLQPAQLATATPRRRSNIGPVHFLAGKIGRLGFQCGFGAEKARAAPTTFFRVPSNGRNKSVSGWANDEAVYCMRAVGCG